MINGIININKEKGFTSHDVVAKLRGIVGQRKIGHTGTLDPDATGVLPVCLGKGTKLCDMLTDKNKTYETVLLLGLETDTQDVTGEILAEGAAEAIERLDEKQVEACIMSFVGKYDQVPPMYSALKVNGKKLYELAREGKVIERKARPVEILSIEITKVDLPEVTMTVSCSKGTYIRTLCHDIGQKLEVGGCMKELKRTKVSRFEIADSLTLGEVQALKDAGKLMECIQPVDSVFQQLEAFYLPEQMEWLAFNGNPLNVENQMQRTGWEANQQIRVYDSNKRFIGIYLYKSHNETLKLEKMFLDKESN
ncbi:MAG: tRNA pseudouridine(55) synthase TruB [Eubacteriales bacterium]